MLNLIKRFISEILDWRKRIILNRKISRIYRTLVGVQDISDEKIRHHLTLWKKLGSRPNLKWYRVFATINRNDDPSYITEVDYYNKVELTLNNRTFSEAFCDKNSYHKYIENDILPQIFLRNIQGVYYTSDYKPIEDLLSVDEFLPKDCDKIFIKVAVDSGGGKGVELFTKEGPNWVSRKGSILTKDFLEKNYRKNFIIQEYIRQHTYYELLNISSVNTVRILTYRSVLNNEIIPLQSVLRIGKPGSIVDNQASGGIVCGINPNGCLNHFAVDKHGVRYNNINELPIRDLGPVYKYKEIVEKARQLAPRHYYHRLIGFDFCVNYLGEVKLIELNNRNNEINFYQMNNGPLFREYTTEIIDYCLQSKKTICLDFEV